MIKQVPEDAQDYRERVSALKKKLPLFVFMAGDIAATPNKKGVMGCWRKQQYVKLNGLYMLDLDHVEDPRSTYESVISHFRELFGILLVHVTPSQHGLRIVAKANPEVGNLADNQEKLAEALGFKPDEACKDSSRGSFCPTHEDILYINNEIFEYQNDEYDKKFGDAYRLGDSHGAAGSNHTAPVPHRVNDGTTNDNLGSSEKQAQQPTSGHETSLEKNEKGQYTFKGIPFVDIIEEYWKEEGGRPAVGERHTKVLSLANRLRYITDNNPSELLRVIDGCGLPDEELQNICTSACAYRMAPYFPPRLRSILKAVSKPGTSEAAGGLLGSAENQSQPGAQRPAGDDNIDYAGWWARLRTVVNDPLRDVMSSVPDEAKMGATLAGLAMLGTYLTRCWWRHYDGEKRRLSFLVYILGDAASGKSFAVKLDKLIMEAMKAQDKAGREWEQQYKEDKLQRETSSKKAKEAAQEIKHPVIRYVPSTLSNAMLYARLRDAKELIDGEEVHLHLFTFESELSTALRVQTGSWAGKLDLECKSFQNEEAGVDYANAQSANGLYQVNWNQVITGTPDAMNRKIKPLTVLDGLVTRLALFVMPSRNFEMLNKQSIMTDHDAESRLRSWGYKLEGLHGELRCPKLVKAAWDWCENVTREAELNNDVIADYFRKRVPMYIVRYGLVYAVLENFTLLEKMQKENQPLEVPISKKTIEFAKLMGDFIFYMQIRQYGEMVRNALENQSKDFQPRERVSKYTSLYQRLPNILKNKDVMDVFGINITNANLMLSRWSKKGWVEAVKGKRGLYKKIVKIV